MALKLSNVFGAFLLLLVIQPFATQSRTLKPTVDSSKFLQNLEGSYRGQSLKGLQQLKRYLHAYGYLTYNDMQNTKLTDDFDEVLESALKTYQRNYNLKVTGILDSDTIKEMMIKRCGNPDIIHHIPSKTKSREFHTVAHYQFFAGTPRWPSDKTNLVYTFDSGVEVVSLEELRPIIKRAFQSWEDVSPFTFEEATDQGAEADIVIGFYSLKHGDSQPFDGPGKVLAHAGSPMYGLFHFDADENWSSNPRADQDDLESVALHEIGHLLGLDHSLDPNAVMFSEIPGGTVKRELTQDDINGIRALYPN